MDLADLHIENLIIQGKTAEALKEIRGRKSVSGRLLEVLCDLADPDKPKRMGRPVERKTSEYRDIQDKMMYEYYFLKAYYKSEGRKNPGQLAKDAVIEAYGRCKSFFEDAQKQYSRTYKTLIKKELEYIDEHQIDFPDWIKKYDK